MNLFFAAGVDLPSAGSRPKRSPPPLPHAPLFSAQAVEKALTMAAPPTPEEAALAVIYAKRARSPKFAAQKETSVRNIFFDEVLVGLLGYERFSGDGGYSLAFEHMLRRKPVDVALGRFGEGADLVVAPFEMKGPDTPDLDKIMPGRGLSPVQQAWDYAADAPGATWVLVSNCLEVRLYRWGRGREAFERLDLTRLDEPNELRRLLLLLRAKRLIGGATDTLLRASDDALKAITDDLYTDFKRLRGQLVAFLADSGEGPKLALTKAIETAQKLLDRVIFIGFACGNGMLPEKIFAKAMETVNEFDPQPVWRNVRELFRWIDAGRSSPNPNFDVWPYNGGLFAADPDADAVTLPDALAEDIATLTQWDFGREVSVNVLGHIFEQSIGDIEKLRDGAAGRVSQRKREGVVYTPDHVTRFLVERTIGETLRERFETLLLAHAGIAAPGKDGTVPWPDDLAEQAFWNAYLRELRSLTIVDPACGSGAFLVAAFDALAAEYRRVTERLADFGSPPDFDIYDEILTKNLFGVDLNVESAEIARLALWLKTARRRHRLARLDQTICAGDSLIDEAGVAARPFDWRAAFPDVFAAGGFDIVIGNPPYVRMEHLKAVKPWLATRYAVADERTDLSAYFFERGVKLLKGGGRLGFISTSSFFRAGYGEKLRLFLGEYAAVETVVDYGDRQIFEGVTTYPAILTMRRKAEVAPPEGELRYLKIADAAPNNLSGAFAAGSLPMPRARLTGGSWQFEDDALARLREKIVKNRPTLGERYGAPLYGIKTGLNEAFVIDTATRDRLVEADPRSAELLKPFLKGENVKRWRVEPEGLWLINTPKGKVRIDDYPAIRDWLLPFRDRLEARATQQEWWELQQAQLAYQPKFEQSKIVFQRFQDKPLFCYDENSYYVNNACWCFRSKDLTLLSVLNSKLGEFYARSTTTPLSGGFYQLNAHQLTGFPIFDPCNERAAVLEGTSEKILTAQGDQIAVNTTFHHRLLTDLAAPGARLSRKLEEFHTLSFAEFRAEAKRALKADIPVKERRDWEALHAEASAEVKRLMAGIAAAEREIDRLVYAAFDLTAEEIALLEASLASQA